ncbi:leucine-rich repeat domain-containing protein [Paenibacillus albiflavus]|uniref:Leucine-rich repeat domain-containing protein n=1 Tax=Paenibacillus albiflavus TaxID=2545760 RepID=A0A4R4EF55_9BACL|nr:leucine-rich repeat domain-containing protein [Paenibacillus albiflavus]TCZ78177.1 leucine-rich repeat domain-containing protein [Paenibacillus albiflavus]
MELIKLTCPNCNGKIEYKEGHTFKCPYCETELLLKENNVTINNYYGTSPVKTTTQPNTNTNLKKLFLLPIILICAIVGYFLVNNNQSENTSVAKVMIRTMPESEVLLFFLKDILNKGEAMPTEEEIATIRYLSTHRVNNEWHFAYSFDDPFTNKETEISDYVITDKLLNTQRIEQKDFEAFSGLTVLNLMGEYEISQSQKVSFRHMQGLKSYTGGFNESFRSIANYFGDKAKIVELSTQIRSNEEMALLLEFPNLRSLAITYVDESVTDFQLLNQLPLKSLSIALINDLKWLSSLTSLESLTVDNTEATDFSSLYALSQLQELKLLYVRNLKTLDFIQNMPNLQSLDLDNVNITNLERLRNKLSLTNLRLSSLYKMESIEVVNSLTSLTELSINGYSGTVSSIILPNLKRAKLSGSFIPKLEALALKSLTVYIRGTDYLDGADLVKHPQLEQLSLVEHGNFTGIRSLNHLPRLQTINLNETVFYDEMNALFNLQHVKTLNCNECWFQINSQDPFANNTLEHFTLNHASFRIGNGDWLHEIDKVMPYFADFTALRSFTMQDSSLESLNFMKNWKQIEVLHLENNAISNVEPLVNLPNLQKLYILGNQVQNKSVLDKGILIY